MTPDQTTQLRAVLDALKKIQAERTQGDWRPLFHQGRGSTYCINSISFQIAETTSDGFDDDTERDPEPSNARAICASVNLDLAGIEAMEGLLNLPCHAQYQTHAMGPCVWCQDKLKILAAFLTRAEKVLEGLGVGL